MIFVTIAIGAALRGSFAKRTWPVSRSARSAGAASTGGTAADRWACRARCGKGEGSRAAGPASAAAARAGRRGPASSAEHRHDEDGDDRGERGRGEITRRSGVRAGSFRSSACLNLREVIVSSPSVWVAARRASGFFWRSVGATSASKKAASRSAKCLYIVRCRGSIAESEEVLHDREHDVVVAVVVLAALRDRASRRCRTPRAP